MLVFVLLVCCIIAGLETSRILEQRAEALAAGKRDTANLANSLTQHAELTFRAADAVLLGLVERLETHDLQDSERTQRLNRWFHAEIERLPQVAAFSVTDSTGRLVFTSVPGRNNIDISDRDFYRHHVDSDERKLFIGAPVFGRVVGRWVIPISRRYNNPDGSFAGTANAFLGIEFLQVFYEQMDIGAGGSILLMSADQKLLVRRPYVEANIGRDMSGSNIAKALQHSPADTVELKAMLDGVVRINSYRRSSSYPLILAVAKPVDEILAPWRSRSTREISETGIILATIALGGLLVRQMARRLATSAIELGHANLRFDIAINNMTQGLCLYDADRRIVISNRKYAEIYCLDEEQVKPGTSLREVMTSRGQRGTELACPDDDYRDSDETTHVQELADGRTIAIVRQLMPRGGWLSTHEDITERRRNEKQIAYLAEHDQLTGLPNRASFLRTLDRSASGTVRHAVFLLDLDKFKDVNDTLGHAAGDELLQEVASRLRSEIGGRDVVARLGGDEFAIVQRLENGDHEAAISLARRIIDLIARPFELDGQPARIGASIGIVLSPELGVESADLLRKADLALYAVKAEGRNGFRFYDAGMSWSIEGRKWLEAELRIAIERNEFELFYQPILDVSSQTIRGAEAVIRWHHPRDGLVQPERFISLAEETGLIVPLGEWILRQGCRDAATWPADFRIAINLSARQFKKGDLFDTVLHALVASGLSPERLELEVTETTLLGNEAENLHTLRRLKDIGVTIVLDDFGPGYSSASYVTQFPFDKIKIDKSFVQGMTERRECAAVVASILALAKGLGIAVTAEGVETPEQLRQLTADGVVQAQGDLIGRPAPADAHPADVRRLPERSVA
ncbi:MAG: EAL domain-containing protein [Bradyrhizobium sp.]|uniref:bifunctional diguanylate cyclase/phosphodiesterase n=1 Tax=Bradyrhizobium sp. TaxID=376 RepID=UPI001DDF339B|nr:EAL domain-containing protein [Bradyrhizobium sp.]MBV9564157.1 EAL domain-containing protein [Bradyrhizobium sp.]